MNKISGRRGGWPGTRKETEDADVVVVSYGITSRVALPAIEMARRRVCASAVC